MISLPFIWVKFIGSSCDAANEDVGVDGDHDYDDDKNDVNDDENDGGGCVDNDNGGDGVDNDYDDEEEDGGDGNDNNDGAVHDADGGGNLAHDCDDADSDDESINNGDGGSVMYRYEEVAGNNCSAMRAVTTVSNKTTIPQKKFVCQECIIILFTATDLKGPSDQVSLKYNDLKLQATAQNCSQYTPPIEEYGYLLIVDVLFS